MMSTLHGRHAYLLARIPKADRKHAEERLIHIMFCSSHFSVNARDVPAMLNLAPTAISDLTPLIFCCLQIVLCCAAHLCLLSRGVCHRICVFDVGQFVQWLRNVSQCD